MNLAFPNGGVITSTFDAGARLAGTYLKSSGGTLLDSHAYGYNSGSQRSFVTNFPGDFWSYTYDDAGQLRSGTGKESGGTSRLQEQFGYKYDAGRNLRYRTNNALIQSFEVNALTELSYYTRSGTLTVAGNASAGADVDVYPNSDGLQFTDSYNDSTYALSGVTLIVGYNSFESVGGGDAYGRFLFDSVYVNLPAAVSYVYDQNGNLTSDGRYGYTYDDENRLTRITGDIWTSTFLYDGKGRLRWQVESNYNAGWRRSAKTRYVYDGMLPIQERDGNNVPVVTYTRGRDLSGSLQKAGGIGGLLARTDHGLYMLGLSSAHAYYHADGNGNVTALVNDKQNIVARYSYDPYGNTLSLSGPLADANTYRFSSKEIHRNTGLYYYGYRFYNPNLQRWLNNDPIGEAGGLNLYTFVENNPVTDYDSLGAFVETIIRTIIEPEIQPPVVQPPPSPIINPPAPITTRPPGFCPIKPPKLGFPDPNDLDPIYRPSTNNPNEKYRRDEDNCIKSVDKWVKNQQKMGRKPSVKEILDLIQKCMEKKGYTYT